MQHQWCANVMRPKAELMTDVMRLILRHFDGIAAGTQSLRNNGFIEVIKGLFQTAKQKVREYAHFETTRTVLLSLLESST